MASVWDILREIESLDDEQRLLLEQQLAQRAQTEWDAVAGEARELARQRGIDQAAIDEAVKCHRDRR